MSLMVEEILHFQISIAHTCLCLFGNGLEVEALSIEGFEMVSKWYA